MMRLPKINDLQACKNEKERIKFFNSIRSSMDPISRLLYQTHPDSIDLILVF